MNFNGVFQEINQAQGDMVSIADLQGRLVYLNTAGRRLLGIALDAPLERIRIHQVHPEWAARMIYEQAIPAAVAEGRWCGPTALLSTDGREIPCLQTILAHRDGNGEVACLSTIIHDTTEQQRRQRSENRLHKQAVQLRKQAKLLDLAHDVIMVHDLEDRVTYWNRGAELTFGWSAEEMIGVSARERLKSEFPVPFEQCSSQLFVAGFWEGEVLKHTRQGKPVWILTRWALQRDEQGRPESILEIGRDITERKRAAEQIEIERKRLFSLLNMLPGFVALKDRQYRVRYASQGYVDIFGDPGKRTCHENQFDSPEACEDCPMQRVLNTSQPVDWEKSLPDGRAYHIWAFPYADENDEPMLLEMGVDVTPRKQLEILVSQASEAERRLIGRDLHDALGQTLSGLSFLIGSFSERLKKAMPDQKATADLIVATIGQAVTHVRMLAQGLDPVGLQDEGLPSALGELAESSSRRGAIDCSFHCSDNIPVDEFDATHLYRIAQEAVSNAILHSGAKKIDISLARAGDSAVLTVIDDGDGFDFDSGARDGLGLRVMRYRSDAVGASLMVATQPGGGTKVTCRLPLKGKGESNE